MPVPALKGIAKETGVSLDTLESYWGEAKKDVSSSSGKAQSDFSDKEWATVMSIVKKRASTKEKTMSKTTIRVYKLSEFIESDMSAQEFIESLFSETASVDAVPPDLAANRDDLGFMGFGMGEDEPMTSSDFNIPTLTHKHKKDGEVDTHKEIDAMTGFNSSEEDDINNHRTILKGKTGYTEEVEPPNSPYVRTRDGSIRRPEDIISSLFG